MPFISQQGLRAILSLFIFISFLIFFLIIFKCLHFLEELDFIFFERETHAHLHYAAKALAIRDHHHQLLVESLYAQLDVFERLDL
mmetsp:Transcript_24700/g.24257  ORF Transcript_24700/g.24257 Transcript_24700/m.24257 type:complete len:85 (-) Transcript_24700:75-329(-)